MSGSGSNYIWSVLYFNLKILSMFGQRGEPLEQGLSFFTIGWQIVPFICRKLLNPRFSQFFFFLHGWRFEASKNIGMAL